MADKYADLEIFILSGQSNMSGRGGIRTVIGKDGYPYKEWDRVVPVECAADPGSIVRFNKNKEWEEAQEPLHVDIDVAAGKAVGIGPGLVFAASLLRARKAKGEKPSKAAIGLVPCAIGATSIKEWERGSFLYNRMIERTKAALEKGGTLKALLWYQGESDTTSKELAGIYGQRLTTFFRDVQADLQNPNLPIIQEHLTEIFHQSGHPRACVELDAMQTTGIGCLRALHRLEDKVAIQWPDATFPDLVEEVREAQKAVVDPIHHVYLVDALGLPAISGDDVHLSTEGQTTLGLMLLVKYTTITDSEC